MVLSDVAVVPPEREPAFVMGRVWSGSESLSNRSGGDGWARAWLRTGESSHTRRVVE